MALPVPNLDDRRFQDLVNESKRLVQRSCPTWTDHNVHDPGVTLIELFAWMSEQLIYRLNRVPDKVYVKFLELLGVRLFPPTAARAPITFWLAAPQPEVVRIPAGTEVATVRTETDEAIVFATVDDLPLVPSAFLTCATRTMGGRAKQRRDELDPGPGFLCFSSVPIAGDTLLVGLTEAAPSCAVTLRLDCPIGGLGIDPRNPPLAWEAWDGENWAPCELQSDSTSGLNGPGDVVLHVPHTHAAAVLDLQRAGWLRVRVTPTAAGQRPYKASPVITRISAFTCGGTVDAVNAETVAGEVLGYSEGVPGQRFHLRRTPVVPGEPLVLEVIDGEDRQDWTEVPDFGGSKQDDSHFTLDAVTGQIQLGPGVREPDGSFRQYGRVPPKGALLRLRRYRAGGGSRGNVTRGAISVLKSSIPYIKGIEQRRPAAGGVDGEDIENAKVRGPILLRTRGRAVTTEDYEELAREVAPEVARVRCLAAGEGAEAGSVRVLVVPSAASSGGRLTFDQLVPAPGTVEKIGRRLDECRLIGSRVLVEVPRYRGLTVAAWLRARPRESVTRIQEQALEALYLYFNPMTGGPDRLGWPFGRPVNVGDVYSVLQALRGVELVEDVRLYGADPVTGEHGDAVWHLELEPLELIFSYNHQVQVQQP